MFGSRACFSYFFSPWGSQGLPVVSMLPGAPAVTLLARCTAEFVHRCTLRALHISIGKLPCALPVSLLGTILGDATQKKIRHGLLGSPSLA